MVSYLILVVSAVLLFAAYNGVAIGRFGVPSSLSETFYLYQGVRRGLGYVFTAMMVCMVLLLMPAWLSVSEAIGAGSSTLPVLRSLRQGLLLLLVRLLLSGVASWRARCIVYRLSWRRRSRCRGVRWYAGV